MTLRRALSTNIVFLTLMALTIFAAGTATAYVIQRQKNAAVKEALEHSSLHTRAFEEHLTRSLETIQRLADFIAAGSAVSTPENIEEFFRRILSQAPFLRSLSVLDAADRIIASSNSGNLGRQIDTKEYFPHVATSVGTYLRIGSPWSGRDFDEGAPVAIDYPRPATGLGFVPVLYRGQYKDSGVRLVVALNPDFFISYCNQWLPAEAGFVDILRYDGLTLMTSGKLSLPGEQHPDEIIAQMLQESEIGSYQGGKKGQRETFTSFRVSRQFPLMVVTHLYRDQELGNWQRESRRLSLLVGVVLLAMANLATVLYRREKRITTAQEAERRSKYERLAATVFETVLEAVMVTDAEQHIIAVNPAFTRITGYSAEEAIGADFSLLASGYHNDDFHQMLQQSLATKGHWEGEIRNRRKTGEIFVAWLSINQILDDSGHVLHLVTGFSDITEYCVEAERIAHLAHHDLLTGLPNRALLFDRLRQGLRQAHRDHGQLALIFFDLDKFKPVNDGLGHLAGDHLLQELATRLQRVVRAADTLARLGGDEFVVLLPVIKDRHDAVAVAEKIRQAVDQPFQIDGHHVDISASIGIAFYPDHATDAEGLMQRADCAMYLAKTRGGNQFVLDMG